MAELGRILIADDEETFLNSTADLLRREGYECDCVPDARVAVERLRANSYDLLIADIQMHGNPELELVKEIPNIAEGIPVILVTGNPSIDTATRSIQLSVEAYMIKPFDFDELLMHVNKSIERYRVYRSVYNTKQRLQEWYKDLNGIEKLVSRASGDASSVSINTFFVLTLRNIVDSLLDLKHLIEKLAMTGNEQHVCNLLKCPRITELESGLVGAVDILRKTKEAFKSKELGELRNKLEKLTRTMAK
jgi:DNA-binding response OmpR family regulator